MMAAATNLERKGVAPKTPDRPALNPGSRSAAITTGIIGQAMYAPTKTIVPSVKRQPICSAVNSGSAVAMATSSKSRQLGHPNEAREKFAGDVLDGARLQRREQMLALTYQGRNIFSQLRYRRNAAISGMFATC
jgi:hypothetical protein